MERNEIELCFLLSVLTINTVHQSFIYTSKEKNIYLDCLEREESHQMILIRSILTKYEVVGVVFDNDIVLVILSSNLKMDLQLDSVHSHHHRLYHHN